VQRAQLESHIERATKSHFDLACGELWDTQEKLKKLEGRVNSLYDIQRLHQCKADSLRQQHHLQAQLKQEVNTCQTKLRQKITLERNMLLVLLLFLVGFIAFYLTGLEARVQKKMEEKTLTPTPTPKSPFFILIVLFLVICFVLFFSMKHFIDSPRTHVDYP